MDVKADLSEARSEHPLFAAAVEGHPEAWRELHRKFKRRLVKMCAGCAVDPDDFVQNCLLDAYTNRAQVRDVDRFGAWVMTIARRKRARAFEKKAKQRLVPWEEEDASLGEVTVTRTLSPESSLQCAEVLGSLSSPLRRCLIWRHAWGCTTEEIAAREGVSLSTAKRRIDRAGRRASVVAAVG